MKFTAKFHNTKRSKYVLPDKEIKMETYFLLSLWCGHYMTQRQL